MRLLVTGGAGYLGAEVVEQALAAGADVAAAAKGRGPDELRTTPVPPGRARNVALDSGWAARRCGLEFGR